ncbi:Six-hairpin glycosidase-like protein [Mariannaea sp. PMI_226]|nr:Six-hairpin glycosidase-like protein [Mariannaea sp. PMI_226]
MKSLPTLLASLLLLGGIVSGAATTYKAPPKPSRGKDVTKVNDRTWKINSDAREHRIDFHLTNGTVFVLDSTNGSYVLPADPSTEGVKGSGRAWWLPANASSDSQESSYMFTANGPITARCENTTWACNIEISSSSAMVTAHRARPHADVRGDEFTFDFDGSDDLADALAGLYWTSMLPMVVEHTRAKDYPISEGFVISTLASQYSGTYPDVDHEFQIKGRVAIGSDLDLSVVQRMIELELKLAREDFCGLWRTPCALQPDGAREYNVRRNSEDGKTNAVMFLVSGNVEMLQSIWLYVARTKDMDWLAKNIDDIEMSAWGIEEYIDTEGRLWSDVYYEDQVMKDGRETMSAALAANSFGLLAELETLLGRSNKAKHYLELKSQLSKAISEPLPKGYWDPSVGRYIDWVDRNGWAHDHIHLLANILPVMFGMASDNQTTSVMDMIEAEMDEFQRFPTFLSARIQDYNSTEIGDGGPYDLCAAGRYWCWDAAFWSWRKNRGMLRQQLKAVADMARSEDYIMGERYDMDHVYYVDGSPWHGAAHYYEYPCVYTWVMMHDYIGVQPSLKADVLLAPRLADTGTVTLKQSAYELSYKYGKNGFELHNLAKSERSFQLDLSALYQKAGPMTITTGRTSGAFKDGSIVKLGAGASLKIDIQ